MTQYFSEKIKFISFFCILLVLYIHSDFHDYSNEILGMRFNHYLQLFISRVLGDLAVPTFYCISGYLFFRSVENWNSIKDKLKRRIFSLVIPYIIAAIAMVIFFIVINMIPAAGNFMNSQPDYLALPFTTLLYSTLVDSGNGMPIAFHLWFLRNLIVIMATTPILYLFHKKGLLPFTAIAFAVINCLFQDKISSAYFYFIFGVIMLDKKPHGKINPLVFFGIYLLVACFVYFRNYDMKTNQYMVMLTTFLGVCSLWYAFDEVLTKNFTMEKHNILNKVCQYTFFIYLFHEPYINIVRKLVVTVCKPSSFSFALSYLISPIITAAILIGIGMILKKYLSSVYKIATGGR